jgi:ethanolamine utilization microcompartment shell protein EutS
MYSIPSDARRLRVDAYANGASLDNDNRSEIIRQVKRSLAGQVAHRIADECTTTESHMGYEGQHVTLDVYVLTPKELFKIISTAVAEHRDRMRMGWLGEQSGGE